MLLLHNARIITSSLNHKSQRHSWMLVNTSTGLIDQIGNDHEHLSSLNAADNSEEFQKVDCNDCIVFPGLWDAHCHIYGLGHVLTNVADLQECDSIDAMVNVLTETLDSHPTPYDESNPVVSFPKFLEGSQWDQKELGRLPNIYDLDRVTTEVPIVCWRRCWHMCCVNSKALEVCGITRENSANKDGVDHFEDDHPDGQGIVGDCTGILRENAISLLGDLLNQESSNDVKVQELRKGLNTVASHGVTSVCSNDSSCFNISNGWETYGRLLEEGEGTLPCRVFLTTDWEQIRKLRDVPDDAEQTESASNDWTLASPHAPTAVNLNHGLFLQCKRLKIFLDGGLGASTAALLSPYSDNPHGMITCRAEDLDTAFRLAWDYGYTVELHSIGDKAFEIATEQIQKYYELGKLHLPPVITHCQIIGVKGMERIASPQFPQLFLNIQPQFTKSDLPIIEKKLGGDSRVGKERVANSYCWKTLQNRVTTCNGKHRELAGGLAGGSDAPIEPARPLQGMAEAMVNLLHDDEGLNFDDALAMYTYGAARSVRADEDIYLRYVNLPISDAKASSKKVRLGLLAHGFLADFIVTDLKKPEDILSLMSSPTPNGKPTWRNPVLQTWIGGKLVFDKLIHKVYTDKEAHDGCKDGFPGRSGRPIWRCMCVAPHLFLPSQSIE